MRANRLHLLLGGGSAAMLAAIVVIEIIPDPAFPEGEPNTVEATPASSAPVTPDAPNGLGELRERPPFWADRRIPPPFVAPVAKTPPSPPPPPPPPPEPPSSELSLVGIVNGPEGRIAILRLRSSGKLERHVEGDPVVRWGLRRILADRVVLIGGGVETELGFPPPTERKASSTPGGASGGFPRVPSQSLPSPSALPPR